MLSKKYSRDLEADIKKETSGTLQKILITLLLGKRSVNNNPNQAQCTQIAKEILNVGESKIGNNESVFNKYFGTLSPYELACIAQHYHTLTGHTISDAIDKEMHWRF